MHQLNFYQTLFKSEISQKKYIIVIENPQLILQLRYTTIMLNIGKKYY